MIPLQQTSVPLGNLGGGPAAQQARNLPLQAGTMQVTSLPAVTQETGTGLNIDSIMNLMITMMIVVMMMKMMTGAMGSIT